MKKVIFGTFAMLMLAGATLFAGNNLSSETKKADSKSTHCCCGDCKCPTCECCHK